MINKAIIYRALIDDDVVRLREISNYFYRTSGIYFRLCNYFAQMYRYDWYIVDEVYDDKADTEKVYKEFKKVLNFLDNSYIRKTCGDIALEVIKNGFEKEVSELFVVRLQDSNEIIGFTPKTLPIKAIAGDILPPFFSAVRFSGTNTILLSIFLCYNSCKISFVSVLTEPYNL